MTALLASIPSPSSGEIHAGPLTLHAYGLMLLIAIVAATWLTGVLWTREGGDWDLVYRTALWGVAGGIIGARLYHVLTSWAEVPDPKWKGVFEIWNGGLGIWGGIIGGTLAGWIVIHRAGASMFRFMDCVAPGLLLAQAIGRWGNYFNQELFGVPTNQPWGLEIDPAIARNAGYPNSNTFHPVFLYESLWNLLGVGVLLFVRKRFNVKAPGLFCLYVAWYTFARFFLENIRTDEAHEYLGLRLNAWVSVVFFVGAVVCFFWAQRSGRPRPAKQPKAKEPPKPQKTMAIPKGRVRGRR